MERSQEERLRELENQYLIIRTEENFRRRTEERNRRKRTELVAWLALVVGMAGLILNLVDKFT